VNKSSCFKFSLICATVLVAVGATVPQKLFAQETGTVPIIKTQSEATLSNVKDNGTVPIIVTPSSSSYAAPAGDEPTPLQPSVQITVNAPVTQNTTITLSTNNPGAISLPSTATVTPGNSTVTANFAITPGKDLPPANATIYASCNGTEVSCTITITYPS